MLVDVGHDLGRCVTGVAAGLDETLADVRTEGETRSATASIAAALRRSSVVP
jgi:hypothetical protein